MRSRRGLLILVLMLVAIFCARFAAKSDGVGLIATAIAQQGGGGGGDRGPASDKGSKGGSADKGGGKDGHGH
jgi:hypothetical protein